MLSQLVSSDENRTTRLRRQNCAVLPSLFLLFSRLFIDVGIGSYLFRGIIKQPGIRKKAAKNLKSGGVGKAVADSFVSNDGIVNIFSSYSLSVGSKLARMAFCTECDKNRNVSEIIQMVIYGRDSERAH